MIRIAIIQDMRRSGFDLLTVEEAAECSRVSVVTIRRCISEGIIVAKKSRSGSVRIERKEVEDYINGKRR